MAETSKQAIRVFQIQKDEFSFLGNENILTEASDFGYIWDNFFKMGGYDPILPYATDSKPIIVWYTNNAGQRIYFQGLFVNNVEKIPDGYKLVNFLRGIFLLSLPNGWRQMKKLSAKMAMVNATDMQQPCRYLRAMLETMDWAVR